ncbi:MULTISPECIES: LysR family transcriptional regulator [unclassified Leisingera]|uniref:LysR family transcriptional regulator n=1 Tax=unclassified Leisingera TaxID=2614906 RepID=UPI0002DBA50B|nr:MULTISPECIES: LysR family transcriptional regulator [unclassified Leisingera]KIC25304.1 LysR family transcriptional regulator [Leisingera sp. ANG-S3]KIC54644.1 LysR family transcriptional regulator [Leisingera sp. ANG-S]KID10590.1 LysR family transcriptional regulator [Leisingera sp. ANG1]
MDPQWDDMKVFLAVAREASLSGAGRILKMDPATVGRRIARFEAALETPLFVKSPQGYALSAAGDRLLVHAEAAEQAMRAGTEALSGPSDTMSGQIRIGAPDGSANYILPQVCAQIAKDNPDLDIQIVALPRVINLSRREADMAVTVSAPTAGKLLVQKICDYKLHLVASRHYLKEHPPIEKLEDLKGHKMIGYIPDMIFDKELDYLNDIGIERVALASNSVSVQIKMAAQGTAVCIAHDFSLPAHRMLRKILTDKVSLTRSFHLVRHQGDQRSERLNRFAHALSKGIRDEVARLEALT